uniref:Expressed conserved protein n=1 Tax=Angiostrongylus cantonensis TaxID=6313 RepID=A0A0K0DR99_ANGCA
MLAMHSQANLLYSLSRNVILCMILLATSSCHWHHMGTTTTAKTTSITKATEPTAPITPTTTERSNTQGHALTPSTHDLTDSSASSETSRSQSHWPSVKSIFSPDIFYSSYEDETLGTIPISVTRSSKRHGGKKAKNDQHLSANETLFNSTVSNQNVRRSTPLDNGGDNAVSHPVVITFSLISLLVLYLFI